ncbi:MAG: 16S rRNA (guanine(527)-N(7))-methyltransferase RsmG [Terriglobia bacterium]
MAGLLTASEIARELADYHLTLSPPALARLQSYLELLLRWNRRVNLTGIREPRRIVRELLGESLYLSRVLELRGWLVDVGSGAGFPGLAVKFAAPGLRVTLIEARRKKCAFLREAIRVCGFAATEVVEERFESWVAQRRGKGGADIITTRAVDVDGNLLAAMGRVGRSGGTAALLTTASLSEKIRRLRPEWEWQEEHGIPGSAHRVILCGRIP